MIYKRCGRCGKRLPEGQRCPCIAKYNSERNREYDTYRRDTKSRDFYESQAWKRVRAQVLELDGGLDVYAYMTRGEVIPADTVHHIIPLRDDWTRRCDVDNLISLSHGSHSYIETQYKSNKRELSTQLNTILRTYRTIN